MKTQKYSLETIRHSLAHIMALAVLRVYDGYQVNFGIGPQTENGFFYDFEILDKNKRIRINAEDLPKIEEAMKKIIQEGLPFKKKKISLKEAKKFFQKINQPYKLEILKSLEKEKIKEVSLYQTGEFVDLCRGPHIKNTKEAPLSFKLVKVSGAYFQGKETNPMLDRVEGLAFLTEKELEQYLYQLAEAEKRDHRVLGAQLKLFEISEEVGPGLVLWLPKGAILKRIVENYILDEYLKNGYQLVSTPHLARFHLWETSGHSDFYRESMFPPVHLKEIDPEETDDYQVKPMNCPFHIIIYKNQLHSYRDLPLRYTELGTVYRYERSGTLHGLTRVRGFTQDDAHIWCRENQLEEEIKGTLNLGLKLLKEFGFNDYEIYLSTRPEKFIGEKKIWDKAIKALKDSLKEKKLSYHLDEGGGAFYGPKIDIKIKDSLNRFWQCTTIQVDFNLPQKFEMFYLDEKGQKQRPIMIHRALLGSLERFLGILIEHYGGEFPFWLSPIQIEVLPILEKNIQYAQKIKEILENNNFRVELNDQKETLSKRIREAELQKVPYLLIVGDKEEKTKTVALRKRKKGDLGTFKIEELIDQLKKEQ